MDRGKKHFSFRMDCAMPDFDCRLAIELVDNNGRDALFCTVDSDVCVQSIDGKRDEFCARVEELISEWDGKFFTRSGVLDGHDWVVRLDTAERVIKAHGENGYPKSFTDLLALLHEFGVPVSTIEAEASMYFGEDGLQIEKSRYLVTGQME